MLDVDLHVTFSEKMKCLSITFGGDKGKNWLEDSVWKSRSSPQIFQLWDGWSTSGIWTLSDTGGRYFGYSGFREFVNPLHKEVSFIGYSIFFDETWTTFCEYCWKVNRETKVCFSMFHMLKWCTKINIIRDFIFCYIKSGERSIECKGLVRFLFGQLYQNYHGGILFYYVLEICKCIGEPTVNKIFTLHSARQTFYCPNIERANLLWL